MRQNNSLLTSLGRNTCTQRNKVIHEEVYSAKEIKEGSKGWREQRASEVEKANQGGEGQARKNSQRKENECNFRRAKLRVPKTLFAKVKEASPASRNIREVGKADMSKE
jgi:hypothetical protein